MVQYFGILISYHEWKTSTLLYNLLIFIQMLITYIYIIYMQLYDMDKYRTCPKVKDDIIIIRGVDNILKHL